MDTAFFKTLNQDNMFTLNQDNVFTIKILYYKGNQNRKKYIALCFNSTRELGQLDLVITKHR